MKQYEVLISDKANEDMTAIYKYSAEKGLSPDDAANQYDRIADAILSLNENPKHIKIMASEPERSQCMQSLTVDNYIIFFVIKFNAVNIVRVLYSTKDISKRLSEE